MEGLGDVGPCRPGGNTTLPVADTHDAVLGLRTFNAEFIANARSDVPALLAAVTAVLDIHEEETEGDWTSGRCRGCEENWPCATYDAVSAALGVTE